MSEDDDSKHCKVVCVKQNNMNSDRDKPDLEFFLDRRYLIDVSFVCTKDNFQKRF